MNWIISYLDNRKQRALVNNYKSIFGGINAGVPQGSVLGPLLFLFYINDIADNLDSLAQLFADDTSLTFSSANVRNIEVIINGDLSKLNDWSK